MKYFLLLLFSGVLFSTTLNATSTPLGDPIELLSKYIQFQTISTQPQHAADLSTCANWLAACFEKIGLQAAVYPTKGHPIVVAKTAHDPHKRTVLIYGHYDVQPVDPIQEWKHPPFEPYLNKQEGKLYGRGSADDKGPTLSHILGIEKTLKEQGTLPVNLIFLLEGEEEIGSPHLPEFLEEHRKELACDVVVISDTLMAAGNHPAITYATRGIMTMEFIVKGPSQDLHSGIYGGAVANPLTVAAELIASLHNREGRILIPGFYEGVHPIPQWERDAYSELDKLSGGDPAMEKLASVTGLVGEKGFSTSERLGSRPSLDINGIGGGYQEKGTKTIIPKEAFVKLSFRLVDNQNPERIQQQTADYLRSQLPPGIKLEIIMGGAAPAYVMNPHSPDAVAAKEALQEAFGGKTFLLRSGGTLPILTDFKKILGADSLLVGLDNPDCNMHSTNENFLLKNFFDGIHFNQILLEKLAKRTKGKGEG